MLFVNLILLLSVLLVGCTPAPIHVQLDGAAQLNRDSHGRSLPVTVFFYQLREQTAFTQATFWQLWRYDKSTLGNSFVTRKTVVLAPQHSLTVTLSRHPGAQYLGVMAIFRQPLNNTWRTVVRLPSALPLLPVRYQFSLMDHRIKSADDA